MIFSNPETFGNEDNQTDRRCMKHSLQELTELEQAVSQEDYNSSNKR
jgi:hypothetical protein